MKCLVPILLAVTTVEFSAEECSNPGVPSTVKALQILQLKSERSTTDRGKHVENVDVISPVSNGTEKCLHFLHIPKTAGNTMEQIRLGRETRLHLLHELPEHGTSRVGWGWGESILTTVGCTQGTLKAGDCAISDGSGKVDRCSVFHYPPGYDPLVAAGYAGCQTFCISRHPLTRAISEHMFMGGKCDAASFAAYIKQRSIDLQSSPFSGDCHWVPQTTFIGQGKYCQRVLKFENLAEDFDSLMAEYGYPITVGDHHTRHGRAYCDLAERAQNIPKETIDWIEQFFAADYTHLGYEKGVSAVPPH